MSLNLILTILFIIVVAAIIFKIIKSIVKTIFIVSALIIILIFVFGIMVVFDANQFNEKITSQDSIFLLKEGDTILTSFKSTFSNFSSEQEVEIESLDNVSDKNSTYFIFDNSSFEEVTINGQTTTWADILNIIKSSDNKSEKNSLLAQSFKSELEENGPAYLMSKIKRKQIEIFPNSMFIKFIRYIPDKIFEKLSPSKEVSEE